MTDGMPLLERLIEMPPEERRQALMAAGEIYAKAYDTEWAVWAHEGQMPERDDWTVCVMKCGRGFGKTRAGAEWVSEKARAYLAAADRQYGGTRFGRQELLGEMIEDLEGSLWPRQLLEASRIAPLPREAFRRVVIGVDPPMTAHGDQCGIVACGLLREGIAYVLGDHSEGGLSPEQWARKVAGAAERWQADRIVAEGNQGGELVESVLRGAGLRLGVKRVHATLSKVRRAEPIAAFFETGDAKLAGRFPDLEDQLAGLVVGGDYQGPTRSPDRADAMVWAMTELLLGTPSAEPRIRRL